MTRARRTKTAVQALRARTIVPGSPRCRLCRGAMRLFGIEPHPTIERATLRSYVCDRCDSVETATMSSGEDKASAPALPPSARAAFDDQMTTRLGEAYEAAWQALEASGSPLAEASRAASTRERLAKCILEIGRRGETDSDRLAERALVRLARFGSVASRLSGH